MQNLLKIPAIPEECCSTWEPGNLQHPWCLLLQGAGSISRHRGREISSCSFCPDLLPSCLLYWEFQHVHCDLAHCSREAWGLCWDAPHTARNDSAFNKVLWIWIQVGWEGKSMNHLPQGGGEGEVGKIIQNWNYTLSDQVVDMVISLRDV